MLERGVVRGDAAPEMAGACQGALDLSGQPVDVGQVVAHSGELHLLIQEVVSKMR